MRVYMDNSATSFPKPKEVIDNMVEYMTQGGSNISRSTSAQANSAGYDIFTLREKIARFFNAKDSRNVVFSKNITESLNIVIKGYVQNGDAVMISSLEHNAVTRPLVQQGAKILAISVSPQGVMDIDFVQKNISKVKALICTHVSNVSGDVMPIDVLAEICRKNGIPFIVDAAQSAGLLPIDMQKTPIDCLCFTGHKALLGPSGTGGMVIGSEFAEKVPPLLTGGTGSKSDDEVHPSLLPDKYEAGTQNIAGLIGLSAGIDHINQLGLEKRFAIETALGQEFFEKISSISEIKIIGSKDYSCKPPVFSLDFLNRDNAEISYILSSEFGVDNRVGIHCAPRAHQSYGTFPHGTLRLSLSHFTTKDEIAYVADAIHRLKK
ncbi:MAG: aminotransferase class V-fold PLP-dependent enzyme [Peptostreptococcaceae bacterium]|nr:aminotransferase class V-fold PLP-dependent enzyme [Peptostreptococcaceae bacterium]